MAEIRFPGETPESRAVRDALTAAEHELTAWIEGARPGRPPFDLPWPLWNALDRTPGGRGPGWRPRNTPKA